MDHYKVLGVERRASKEEIKEAFRRLALEFHPDRHSQSSKSVRDTATSKFKQISEAYDVLSDDRKRADYNIRYSSSSYPNSTSSRYYNGAQGYGYGYHENNYRYYYSYYNSRGGSFTSMLENVVRYLNTRAFLLHLAFAGALCGGVVAIDKGRDLLWKLRNSGKSFEDAMDSIEKAKEQR